MELVYEFDRQTLRCFNTEAPRIKASGRLSWEKKIFLGSLINLYSLCLTRLSTTAGSARVEISPKS